jgi:hypothetical protein
MAIVWRHLVGCFLQHIAGETFASVQLLPSFKHSLVMPQHVPPFAQLQAALSVTDISQAYLPQQCECSSSGH